MRSKENHCGEMRNNIEACYRFNEVNTRHRRVYPEVRSSEFDNGAIVSIRDWAPKYGHKVYI